MVKLRLVTPDDDRSIASAQPRPHECVACFVDRMTREHGCSNQLRWTTLWRDRCAPRATALERNLRAKGGYCDCEVLANVFTRHAWLRQRAAVAEPIEDERDREQCLGIRRGSARACELWVASPY